MRKGAPTIAHPMLVVICNIVFFGFICWAFLDQYPHPDEEGIIIYTVLMVLTPILNLVVFFRIGTGNGWLGLHMKRKALEEQSKVNDTAQKQNA